MSAFINFWEHSEIYEFLTFLDYNTGMTLEKVDRERVREKGLEGGHKKGEIAIQ